MEPLPLKIQKIHHSAIIPSFAYRDDAGMDLFSIEQQDISPGELAILRTGLKICIPKGYAGFIWDKSGLATTHHLATMGGVIDSNYRGELQVILINLGKELYRVEKGSKIAQLIISPVATLPIEIADINDRTDRGAGKFGSSGV